MNSSEIIELLKQPAIDAFVAAAESKRILPSILIAGALIKLEGFSEDELELLIGSNNYQAIKAGKKYTKETVTIGENKYKVYESPEEFISTLSDFTGAVMSYSDALQKKNFPESILNSYTSTITGYGLDKIDEEAVETLYSGNKTVVETLAVKEEEEKAEEEVTMGASLEGGCTCGNCAPVAITNTTVATDFSAGVKLNLIGANLYETPTSTSPTRVLTGAFYIVDGVRRNDRYGIVMNDNYVGDPRYTLGFVKKNQLTR